MIIFFCGSSSAKEPVDYVNVLIGTGGFPHPAIYGGTIPAVGSPFAMINWTPMTRLNGDRACSYFYADRFLIGFIGTRQPAVFMGDYGSVSIMPGVGPVQHEFKRRGVRLDHGEETATPYYYAVRAGGIKTEMTATERAAIFRITYPESGEPHLIIDASREEGDPGLIEILPDQRRIAGYNSHRDNAPRGPALPNFKGWFVIEFNRPLVKFGTYNLHDLHPGQSREEDDAVGAYVIFSPGGKEPLLARIGTSLISAERAEGNLNREIPGFDFEKVKENTRAAWNDQLSRILVEGGTEDMKTNFYTAMYHAHLYPRIFSEYGRYYSAFDDQVHEGVSYSDYSLWDTFRAEHPLLILTASERVSDMVNSLLQMYKEGGWLPRWPNPSYTGSMIGSHSDSVIAEAYVKGLRGFDLDLAYEAVYKNAMVPPESDANPHREPDPSRTDVDARQGLTWYKEYGYIPLDKMGESVSSTLEFAYDDFCVAQLAKAAGKDDDYKMFMERSHNYRNLYHDGYFQARRSEGSWAGPRGYTEALKWHYMFFAPQDVPDMIELMGGDKKFAEKLDKVFAPGVRIYRYLHTNEPVHHYIYLYDYCGEPWKAQKLAAWATAKYYHNKPGGLPGNDDCGQMSAWYIFSTIGFYPVTPCSDYYALGSPRWERVTIHIGQPYKEAVFTIVARNQGPKNIYIQSAELNGKPLDGPFLKHEDIIAGGELILDMATKSETDRKKR